MSVVGVIPAGGSGKRWGGFQKMLLPIAKGEFLIDRTIKAMVNGGAEKIVVVPNAENISLLSNHLKRYANVALVMDTKMTGIYSGMEASFPFAGDRNLFAMPDTVFPTDVFGRFLETDFMLGTHTTNMPERFGVIFNGKVVDKQKLGSGEFDAWGVLEWSRTCVEYWQDQQPKDYTHAINLAIGKFGLHTFPMEYYYDLASFEDYHKLIRKARL